MSDEISKNPPIPDLTPLEGALERRCGAADFHRIWCAPDQFPLNEYRRLEFCGWLVGWAETIADGGRRIDVEIYLTTDGRVVATVELDRRPVRDFASSPPDLWTTFLAERDTLVAARGWLRDVQRVYAPADGWPAVHAALAQAEAVLNDAPLDVRGG